MNKRLIVHRFKPGQIVGELEIVKEIPIDERRVRVRRSFLCHCSCGALSEIDLSVLKKNKDATCATCSARKRNRRLREAREEALRRPYGRYEKQYIDSEADLDELMALKRKDFDSL
jgi:hypothetical protein